MDPRVCIGLVTPEPQELRRREARERPISGELDQAVETDAILDLGALCARSLVVPEDRRAKNAVALVEADEAVHLT